MANSKKNTVASKKAQNTEVKSAPKNSVKVATEEEMKPSFRPANIVRLSGVVCKGSIKTGEEGFVAWDLSHSMGKNRKTNEKNPSIFLRCISSEKFLKGVLEAVTAGQLMTVEGYFRAQEWKKDDQTVERQNTLVVTNITLFNEVGRMPSTNEVVMSGFAINPESFTEHNITRFSLSHPMTYKKDGEQKKNPTVFFNCVHFAGNQENICADIEDKDLLIIKGSLRPNVWQDEEGKSHSRLEFSVRSVSVFDYASKEEKAA